jgi:hypothetical protein
MSEERCAMCCRFNVASTVRCECGSPFGEEMNLVPGPATDRLARAWLSLGCGGLILLLAYALALGHFALSGAALWFAGLGATLMVRGGRVVSRTGVHRLETTSPTALPPARVIR